MERRRQARTKGLAKASRTKMAWTTVLAQAGRMKAGRERGGADAAERAQNSLIPANTLGLFVSYRYARGYFALFLSQQDVINAVNGSPVGPNTLLKI